MLFRPVSFITDGLRRFGFGHIFADHAQQTVSNVTNRKTRFATCLARFHCSCSKLAHTEVAERRSLQI